MAEKCRICGDEIGNTFLEKLDGTVVLVKKGKEGKNEKVYVCSLCQKKHSNKLKEEIEKLK